MLRVLIASVVVAAVLYARNRRSYYRRFWHRKGRASYDIEVECVYRRPKDREISDEVSKLIEGVVINTLDVNVNTPIYDSVRMCERVITGSLRGKINCARCGLVRECMKNEIKHGIENILGGKVLSLRISGKNGGMIWEEY